MLRDAPAPKRLGEKRRPRLPHLVDASLDGKHDPEDGMPYVTKVTRFPELFYFVYDPDQLAPSPAPPAEVQASFEDVFGSSRKFREGKLKVALHPWFRRWCLFEKYDDPQYGEANWRLIQLFHDFDSKKDGYLPNDLKSEDGRYDNLAGDMGDYMLPHREWFGWIRDNCELARFDDEGWGMNEDAVATNVTKSLIEAREKGQAEAMRVQSDFLEDFHDYNFNFFRDVANIEEGCISNSCQVNQTSHDVINARRDAKARKEAYTLPSGVKVRVRPGGRFDALYAAEAARLKREQEQQITKLANEAERRHLLRIAKEKTLGREGAKKREM
tara:strand:- start:160 stop:1143 length:984 start_codon:yes stop_codon:yes gene_type:complete